jgi:hypothetical protein
MIVPPVVVTLTVKLAKLPRASPTLMLHVPAFCGVTVNVPAVVELGDTVTIVPLLPEHDGVLSVNGPL